jgi:hypothetical protein
MKISDLFEAATSNLYHSTRLYNAANVLEQGYFKLAASVGTGSELAHQKPGRFYYLSTTRSKVGDYTLHNYHIDGVVFNLNGDWLNQRYKAAPIDYWERMWLKRDGRTSEAEDRVYSQEPIIPLPDPASKLITAIHVLYESDKIKLDDDRAYWLRKLLTKAKLMGIPISVYDDPQAWLTQDQRRAVDLKSLIGRPEPKQPSPWPRIPRDWFEAWRELYHKSSKESLSPDAKRIMDRLQRDYSGDMTRSLEADIHNQKSANDSGLIKLLQIFRKLKINSAAQYVDYLKKKWRDQ